MTDEEHDLLQRIINNRGSNKRVEDYAPMQQELPLRHVKASKPQQNRLPRQHQMSMHTLPVGQSYQSGSGSRQLMGPKFGNQTETRGGGHLHSRSG